MAEIITKQFDSWNKLSKFIDDTFTYFKGFSFRGHADSNWNLESTLARVLNRKEGYFDKTKLVSNHLENFKQNLRGRSQLNLTDISENELYAIDNTLVFIHPY